MSEISACSSPVQCRSTLPLVYYWTLWGSVFSSVKRGLVVHTSQDWVTQQVLSKHSSLLGCLLLFPLPHFRSVDTSVLYFSHHLSHRLGICLWNSAWSLPRVSESRVSQEGSEVRTPCTSFRVRHHCSCPGPTMCVLSGCGSFEQIP